MIKKTPELTSKGTGSVRENDHQQEGTKKKG